ncbi:MAG TPA: phage portal protein [Clostridiaceae bacterium]|nr:phage portal protein [Clostridiaceae bacterium]
MLTSLNFLAPGNPWPPPTEAERLEKYAQNRLLFEGKHEQVYKDWIRLLREDQQATLEMVLNWHKRLTTLFADLLLGEPPRIKAGDQGSQEQQTVERIIDDNGLFNVAYEVALDVSRYGTGVFKVRYDGRAIIEGQQPAIWFPVVKPDNVKEIQAHVLAWTYEQDTQERGRTVTKKYLKAEIHEKGKITTVTYPVENGIIDQAIERKETETGVNEFLVVPVNNILTTDRVTGLDDYSDLDTIIQELEVRVAQISRILDKHADPNMYGPEIALEQDTTTGQWGYRAGGKYFPVGPEEQPPGYVTWDGKLDAAFKQIELLMEQLYILSETSAAAFGQLKSGLAESGTALRRLMMAPLAKVNRIRMRFDPALKEVLWLASLLEKAQGMAGAVVLENIHIDWKDGLPDDDKELTQNETQRYTAGLTSLESSLRRLYGLEGQALQEEINRIRAEQAGQGTTELPSITLPPAEGEEEGEGEE